jgi:hypothetical protein
MINFDDLESDFDSIPTTREAAQVQYTCTACNGSGLYLGVRLHQERSDCFACGGKGFFKTSALARSKARDQRVQREATKEESRWSEFASKHATLAAFLVDTSSWSAFSGDLVRSVKKYGNLSERQLAAAYASEEKHIARQAAKQAERAAADAGRVVLDLTRINELFAGVLAKGLKKPVLRADKLAISIAPDTGKNAGCLYVKDEGEYAGKIDRVGKFFKLREARAEIEAELIVLATDPRAAAIAHGRNTGNCSCCGRQLTDPKSIELGIGPICLEKWAL